MPFLLICSRLESVDFIFLFLVFVFSFSFFLWQMHHIRSLFSQFVLALTPLYVWEYVAICVKLLLRGDARSLAALLYCIYIMNSQGISQVNKNLTHICTVHFLTHRRVNMQSFILCLYREKSLESKLIEGEALPICLPGKDWYLWGFGGGV